MKKLIVLLSVCVAFGCAQRIPASSSKTALCDTCKPAKITAGGLLGKRVDLWRNERMGHLVKANNEYLISGFESKPGVHPWQGEHLGKWLHAAALAYEQTHDEKLLKEMQTLVNRLLATQEPDGYMGTYIPKERFTGRPENKNILDIADGIDPLKNKAKSVGGWDTWTFRYNIYGLLTYEKFHPDTRVVESCKKMVDLLIEFYKPGKYDLTKYGTRRGISATTLLESIVMLYERTQEQKYLDFALHIVAMSEANPGLRLMGTALEKGSLTKPGDGKAYQLMANLLGYIRLYNCTGDKKYLETAENAWESIISLHTYATGGTWGRQMSYNANKECFALLKDFSPTKADVETCSTTTWIQMNLHLLETTGEAKYAAEAERATFNALLAAQSYKGIDWCYYTKANSSRQPFEGKITCCASSGPRALEMFARSLIGETEGAVSIASLVPCKATLSDTFGNAVVTVKGNYPLSSSAQIVFENAKGKSFSVKFCEPSGAQLVSVRVNGKNAKANKNEQGFYQIESSWKTGDKIDIDFKYQLQSHVVKATDQNQWVAFTYGPWALASKGTKGSKLQEPFTGKKIDSKDASKWLEKAPSKNGVLPMFKVKNSKVVLQPYFNTGSLTAGPQTYFKL